MEALALREWTREEMRRAAEAGVFRPDERLELLDGQIVAVAKPTAQRCVGILLAAEFVRKSARVGTKASDGYRAQEAFHCRTRMPLALGPRDEPEPDVMVVRGSLREVGRGHPSPEQVVLVVEVGDSTLTRDRRQKVPRYALAGIVELWLVDVENRRLEVYREPSPEGYGVVTILSESKEVSPLFRPEARVVVSELLPNRAA